MQQYAYRNHENIYLIDQEIFDLLQQERIRAHSLQQGQFSRVGTVSWLPFFDTLTADQKSRVQKILVPEEGGVQQVQNA